MYIVNTPMAVINYLLRYQKNQ